MEDISLEEAREVLLKELPSWEKEMVPLLDALGRIAAEDIMARLDNPPFDRSPLDGYALAAADTAGASADAPARLRVIGEECAGDFFPGEVRRGEALRIMTGGAMPKGTDAVVRQEDVALEEGDVLVPYPLRFHENYCFAGEDVERGTRLIERGERLRAPHIAVLASQGYDSVPVGKKPRVIVASTGDELTAPGMPLAPGKIYNSNLYLLAGRLREMGLAPTVLGILPDDGEDAAAVIRSYMGKADVFLTTGGVSVGKKDILHEVVRHPEARRLFWRVAMKPGAPAMGYTFGNLLGIALSGNPFAAYATFELLVRPVLARYCGAGEMRRKRGILLDSFPKESRGRRFLRAFYEDGKIRLPEQHASGSLFSAAGCNAFVDVPAGTGPLPSGAEVDALLL